MLDLLKNLFDELAGGHKETSLFADNDYRLAAAALLIHVCGVDGAVSERERAKVYEVLQRAFGLDDEATEVLIAAATQAEQDAVDLYRFTSLLMRALDEEGRRRVVEMMWQIVYSDGKADEFEDNVIWRAADLLGISTRERVELRQRVAGEAKE